MSRVCYTCDELRFSCSLAMSLSGQKTEGLILGN